MLQQTKQHLPFRKENIIIHPATRKIPSALQQEKQHHHQPYYKENIIIIIYLATRKTTSKMKSVLWPTFQQRLAVSAEQP